MIAVIAGNIKQFEEFRKVYNDSESLLYIISSEDIIGRNFTNVLSVGTWYEDSTKGDLFKLCKARIKEGKGEII